jgi:hypothetical protein
MGVSSETGSVINFRSLLISSDALRQKRAELLALREKVSNAERAVSAANKNKRAVRWTESISRRHSDCDRVRL